MSYNPRCFDIIGYCWYMFPPVSKPTKFSVHIEVLEAHSVLPCLTSHIIYAPPPLMSMSPSPRLARRQLSLLQAHWTNAVETARLNRKFIPMDLSVKRKGDVDYRNSNTRLLALMWKENNTVIMLSTVCITTMEGEKPSVVKDYSIGMKGVDVDDHMARYYPTTRRSKVWHRKIFFLSDMAIINAWSVHCDLGGEALQKTFRASLASELLGNFREGADSTRDPTSTRLHVALRQALQQQWHTLV